MRLSAILWIVLTSLILSCRAKIVVDRGCGTSVDSILEDALDISLAAYDALRDLFPVKDANPAQDGLYKLFFHPEPKSGIQALFKKAADVNVQREHTTRIYCRDLMSIADKAGESTYEMQGFFTDDGKKEIRVPIDERKAPTPPGKLPCDYGSAYTFNGPQRTRGGHSLSDQSVIVLCPSFFVLPRNQEGKVWVDETRVNELKSKGLDPEFSALESLGYQAQSLLHEIFHTRGVGGYDDVNERSNIGDGPTSNSYGFKACEELGGSEAIKTADCLALLAVALKLQFKTQSGKFTWATGSVVLEEGPSKYTAYVPKK